MNSVPPTLYSKGVIGPTGAEASAANRYGPTESKASPPGFTPYTNGFGRGTGARIPPARIRKPSTAALAFSVSEMYRYLPSVVMCMDIGPVPIVGHTPIGARQPVAGVMAKPKI